MNVWESAKGVNLAEQLEMTMNNFNKFMENQTKVLNLQTELLTNLNSDKGKENGLLDDKVFTLIESMQTMIETNQTLIANQEKMIEIISDRQTQIEEDTISIKSDIRKIADYLK